jgi:hypothetical protein
MIWKLERQGNFGGGCLRSPGASGADVQGIRFQVQEITDVARPSVGRPAKALPKAAGSRTALKSAVWEVVFYIWMAAE